MAESQNYTLGRGKVYFSRFKTGTRIPESFMYVGNTPEFGLTIENEELPHYSSDGGIREKDDSVPLEVTRTGTMTTDSIRPRNVALFFFGTDQKVVQAPVASSSETFTDVKAGGMLKLGISPSNPTGYFGVNPTGLTLSKGATALVLNEDYTVNGPLGTIQLILVEDGGSVIDGDDLTATFAVLGSTRSRVISGSTPVEGAMMFVADNPKGDDFHYFFPYVKITPNGDYNLKGDEWQTIPYNFEALKPEVGEAIYMDGAPVFA